MTGLNTHFVANDDISTAYYDEGSGPVLLLVHGFTGSKLDFHDEVPALAEHYRVIVPDNRGHGETSNIGPYTLAQLVVDLDGFTNVLGLDQFHLLGHSLGGMAAMRYALGHEDKLASLILMDTSAQSLGMGNDYFDTVLTMLQAEDGRQQLVELMKTMPRTPEVENGVQKIGEAEHWRRILLKFEQMDIAAYEGFSAELAELPDMVERLSAISVPTTVMVGEADKPFLVPSANMAKQIPQSTLVTIAAASHCPQYENRDDWFRCVSEHMSQHA